MPRPAVLIRGGGDDIYDVALMYKTPARSIIEPDPERRTIWHPLINDSTPNVVAMANQIHVASLRNELKGSFH
jgi:hypothetical protein